MINVCVIYTYIYNTTRHTPLKSLGLSWNFSSAFSGPPSCTNNVLNALSVGTNTVYGPVNNITMIRKLQNALHYYKNVK